ncbi:polyprenyl synthetase family protein [Brevibacterium litoralis]|uniref:polyprenyl synthetase family protein n=1 Tax=Brevibacterium litoralis TaxID=3138935 RepID=UPI0032EF8F57
MTPDSPGSAPVPLLTDPAPLVAHVDQALEAELDRAAELLAGISPVAGELLDPVRSFAAKGKRIRAMATWWGYELGRGVRVAEHAHLPGIARVAASVELFHAAALVHDDIIDDSDTRRGAPAVHAHFRAAHAAADWSGSAALHGTGAGIIAGDLCLSLSEEVYTRSGLPGLADPRVLAAHDDFRRDVMVGQYLDVRLEAVPADGDPGTGEDIAARAYEVLTYKSAKYSVEQPFLLGAALGLAEAEGASAAGDALLRALSAFGLPLGRAFQLRDDELGVYGDPARTGKPAGDDLRQGKKTVLVGYALSALHAAGDPAAAAHFAARLGAPDLTDAEVSALADIVRDSGALARFEEEIRVETERARTGLSDLSGLVGLGGSDRALLDAYVGKLTFRDA